MICEIRRYSAPKGENWNLIMGKPGNTGFIGIVRATRYSLQGFPHAWTHEAAFRQEIALTLILFPVGVCRPASRPRIEPGVPRVALRRTNKKDPHTAGLFCFIWRPQGVRTAVRGRSPKPLDDGEKDDMSKSWWS